MFRLTGWCSGWHNDDNRKITIGVVYLSLLLDNVLLTMVVPIMPDFLINNSDTDQVGTNQGYQTSYLWDGRNGSMGRNGSDVPAGISFDPGIVTNRFGYPLLLFLGTCTLLVSAAVFAFGTGYVALFFARSFQGVASSCIGITGMCLVAEKYPNEPDRSKMMGFVLGSVAVGVLIGYPFGGFMYDNSGKSTPFLIILLLVCLDGALQLYSSDLKPSEEKEVLNVGWMQLLNDKRILLTGGAIGISTSAIAILEPCLPIWLLQEIKPKKWQLGTAFIPDSLGYFLGTNLVAVMAYQCRRSKIALPAMILVGLSASLVPAAKTMLQLVIPHFLLGFGIGAVDAALVPLLAELVDTRYSTHYGTVYAMQQMSVSLAYFLGPVFGSGITKAVGFPWMMRIVGAINILFCPLLLMLDRFIDEGYSDRKSEAADYRPTAKRADYQQFSDSE